MSSWFVMRRELPTNRRIVLTIISFLFPLGMWALISMWLWRPDVKLDLPFQVDGTATIYTQGDRVDKEYLPTLVEGIQQDNAAMNEESTVSRRENRKRMRLLAPLLVTNKIIKPDQLTDDQAIYQAYGELARETS